MVLLLLNFLLLLFELFAQCGVFPLEGLNLRRLILQKGAEALLVNAKLFEEIPLTADDSLLFLDGFDEGYDEGGVGEGVEFAVVFRSPEATEVIAHGAGCCFDFLGEEARKADLFDIVLFGVVGVVDCAHEGVGAAFVDVVGDGSQPEDEVEAVDVVGDVALKPLIGISGPWDLPADPGDGGIADVYAVGGNRCGVVANTGGVVTRIVGLTTQVANCCVIIPMDFVESHCIITHCCVRFSKGVVCM